jgi:hypothetical protein
MRSRKIRAVEIFACFPWAFLSFRIAFQQGTPGIGAEINRERRQGHVFNIKARQCHGVLFCDGCSKAAVAAEAKTVAVAEKFKRAARSTFQNPETRTGNSGKKDKTKSDSGAGNTVMLHHSILSCFLNWFLVREFPTSFIYQAKRESCNDKNQKSPTLPYLVFFSRTFVTNEIETPIPVQ